MVDDSLAFSAQTFHLQKKLRAEKLSDLLPPWSEQESASNLDSLEALWTTRGQPIDAKLLKKMNLKAPNSDNPVENRHQLIVGLNGISTAQYPCLKHEDGDVDAVARSLREIRAACFDIVDLLKCRHNDLVDKYKVSASLEYEN